MSRVAILGAGEFGKQTQKIIQDQNKYTLIGYYDDFHLDEAFGNVKIIGTSKEILRDFKNDLFDCVFVAIGYSYLVEKYKILNNQLLNIPKATVIHSTAEIDVNATIEEGVIIYPNVYVGPDCVIRTGAVLNVGCILPHDNFVDECTFLSVGVFSGGKTKFGKRNFIGVGANISDSINICDDVIIGVGCTVVRDITKKGTYVGTPSKKIK